MIQRYEPPASEVASSRLAQAREVVMAEAAALSSAAQTIDHHFFEAIERIAALRGAVIVTGMGKAGLIGQKLAATLASTGTPAHFLHPAEAAHGDLGRVGRDDLVLALSHSGETSELVAILKSIKQRGAPLVALTSRRESRLAREADLAIVYGPIDEACPIGVAPSASCAVMLALGDALAFVLMRERSFGHDDFSRLHPAGSLGKQLQLVDERMRTGARLRIAPCDRSVREVFTESRKQGRRTGAVMLVDRDGKLVGLFTDSDLARLIERRRLDALDDPIAQWMTHQPITARVGQRVIDVIAIFKDRQISEIPVLDANDHPVGLVDITDVLDLLPDAA